MMPATLNRSSKIVRLLSLAILGLTLVSATPAHAESDFVKGLVNKWSSFKRWICNDDRPETPIPVTTVPGLRPPEIAPQDRLKSEGELNRYVECYLTEDGRYEKVAKEYMPLIAEAARAFELPKTVLACLIFRESRFDINARSSTGAIGLGQHLTGTMGHITDVLRTSKEKETVKLLEITKLSAKESAAANKTTVAQAQKDLAYANTVLKDRSYRLRWEQMFRDRSEKKCSEQSKKPLPPPKPAKPRTDRKGNVIAPAPAAKPPTANQRYLDCMDASIPRSVNTTTIKDPVVAIGATAMYLHMIIDEFKRNLDSDIKVPNLESQGPNYNVLLAAAGAYNMGPGAAIKILSPIEPPDREKWVQALMKSNEETAGHVASIRNCIESSESPKGNAWTAPIGSHNYDCMAKPTAAQPRTVVGKSTLAAEYQNSVKTASLKPAATEKPKAAASKPAAKPAAAKTAAAKPAAAKASGSKAPASTSSKNGTRK